MTTAWNRLHRNDDSSRPEKAPCSGVSRMNCESASIFAAMLLTAAISWPIVSAVVPVTALAQIDSPRVVILPFFAEQGVDVTSRSDHEGHYRMLATIIGDHLVAHGFEVVDAHRHELMERYYNNIRERPREHSLLAATEMTTKYLADIAYILWLETATRPHSELGICVGTVKVKGLGYDSAGRSIGAGVQRTIKERWFECDDAISEGVRKAGICVGSRLTGRSRSWQSDADRKFARKCTRQ